jgi:predicted AAA+ superfamily ATPase
MYKRKLYNRIAGEFYREKVIIIYGARRVGKTVLCKEMLKTEESKGKRVLYLNCEHHEVRNRFTVANPADLKKPLESAEFIVLDEAQNIENIGLILKILADSYPELQIVATGSSSFDLADKTGEPLTGRARRFVLNPLAITETSDRHVEQCSHLDQMLIFGGYPSVFGQGIGRSVEELSEITANYLYKDALIFENVKGSSFIEKLLQLLAHQVGNEVSLNELATTLGVTRATVERYVDILEKCFVIFRLRALSKNSRKEISKNFKIYFYDLGIRNCLIQNFNPLHVRNDLGALWENFCIAERIKRNSFIGHRANLYFWRTYDQREIDYIEEYGGAFHAYEFKYGAAAKIKPPKLFLETYPSEFAVINRDNWYDQLLQPEETSES